MRKEDFKNRVRTGLYKCTKEEQDRVLIGQMLDDTKLERMRDARKNVEETETDKVEVWELWLKYNVDDDVEEDDIVVVYHKESNLILRAYYNPYFFKFRPLHLFIGRPVEYNIDGEGICGIIEKLQEEIDTIHISGTNGKGSVAYMLNSIFIEAGFKTGLYTSPHLLRLNERIKINNVDISDNDLNKYLEDLFQYLDLNKPIVPTYFDVITFAGFKYFYDSQIDIAIIETGMGGRVDSTNVITPICSVITEISMDHTAILGSSIKEITGEKAGIIKERIPVVTSNSDPEILEIISMKAKNMNSDLLIINRDFSIENITKKNSAFLYDYKLKRDSRINSISGIEQILAFLGSYDFHCFFRGGGVAQCMRQLIVIEKTGNAGQCPNVFLKFILRDYQNRYNLGGLSIE